MARTLALDIQKFAADPAAPVVTIQGTPGSAAYGYKVVAVAENGTRSAGSPAGSIATGNATLDAANFNRVTWSAVPGASSYEVFRITGGATQGKIGATTSTTFDDTGLAGDGGSPPTSNGTGIGAEAEVSDLRDLTAQVDGAFVATLQLQGRIEGASGWLDVGEAQSGREWVLIAQKVSELRVRMLAYTSGEPRVFVAGNGRV